MTDRQPSPIQQWAQLSPSLCALITPEKTYSWQQLQDQVFAVARGLQQQGIGQGSLLTCVGKNSVEQLFIYLASLELGALCSLTMPQSPDELKAKLKTLYGNKTAHIWVQDSEGPLGQLNTIEYRESKGCGVKSHYKQYLLASIVFTSGSTGNPKAVVHTSKQHLDSASGLLERFSYKQGDSWLLSLPMYHVSGLAIVYRWLFSGATLKLGTGNLEHDIQGVTHASLVATQLKRLLDAKTSLSLTHVLLGGSHVPLTLSQQASKLGIETWLGYGMTEAASTVTAKQIDEQYSAGFVLPKREVRLEKQRIFISGETLASGYYNQGVITPLTQNGWFDTKDLGEWIDGELKIIGRADNQFISGGENIHCEEIESALVQLEGIEQAVVVPIEDEEYGHRPVAVMVCSQPISPQKIESNLKGKLTKFKWPIAYYDMPKALTEGGIKVSRKAVKEWLIEQQK